MKNYLLVAIGGMLGAIARYWLGGVLSQRWPLALPVETLVINVSGSFLLGFLTSAGIEYGVISQPWRLAFGVGFLGAYTTFSTWQVESLRLLQQGSTRFAVLNLSVSVALELLAAWTGYWLGRAV